jgi:hypothetical protein
MATLLVASLEETLSMTAFGDADPFRGSFSGTDGKYPNANGLPPGILACCCQPIWQKVAHGVRWTQSTYRSLIYPDEDSV